MPPPPTADPLHGGDQLLELLRLLPLRVGVVRGDEALPQPGRSQDLRGGKGWGPGCTSTRGGRGEQNEPVKGCADRRQKFNLGSSGSGRAIGGGVASLWEAVADQPLIDQHPGLRGSVQAPSKQFRKTHGSPIPLGTPEDHLFGEGGGGSPRPQTRGTGPPSPRYQRRVTLKFRTCRLVAGLGFGLNLE